MLNLAIVGSKSSADTFYKLFNQKKKMIENLADDELEVKYILLEDEEESRDYELIKAKKSIKDFNKILLDPEVDIIIELNGEKNALDHLLKSLKKSKVVITANKKIVAENFLEIKQIIKKYKGKIYFSGCFSPLPIKAILDNIFALDQVKEVNAVLNATTNYILSEMERSTISMKETMEQAQALSYTEKNPEVDLEGLDSLYKISLIADLIYNTYVDPLKIDHKGIKGITSYDIIYAAELGYKIKLLATIKKENDNLYIGVRPNLIEEQKYLAAVDNNSNAVEIDSEFIGKSTYQADNNSYSLANLINNDLLKAVEYIKSSEKNQKLSVQEINKNEKILDLYSNVQRSFYIRLQIEKNQEIIKEIKNIFTEKDLANLVMHDNLTEAPILPVIIMTKKIKEKRLDGILKQVESLAGVLTINNIIPIQVEEN